MPDQELQIQCQRCGSPMEMKDPAPGDPWKPDQFWVCPRCGRHFWSTYPNPPGTPAKPAPAPAAKPTLAVKPAPVAAPKPATAPAAPSDAQTPAPDPTDPPKTAA